MEVVFLQVKTTKTGGSIEPGEIQVLQSISAQIQGQ